MYSPVSVCVRACVRACARVCVCVCTINALSIYFEGLKITCKVRFKVYVWLCLSAYFVSPCTFLCLAVFISLLCQSRCTELRWGEGGGGGEGWHWPSFRRVAHSQCVR